MTEKKMFLTVAKLGSWLLLKGPTVPVLPANAKHKSAFSLKATEWILTKCILNPDLNVTSLISSSVFLSSSLNAIVIDDWPSRIWLSPEKIWALWKGQVPKWHPGLQSRSWMTLYILHGAKQRIQSSPITSPIVVTVPKNS